MKLYHQCGHCTSWNIESLTDDDCGDGLILSPVHERKSTLDKKLTPSVRKASLFDPQYYLPNSQKAKLQTYEFFPEVITASASGFSTLNFGVVAAESAKLCIEFQLQQEFEQIVIPARHFEEMEPNYTDKQDAYTVLPFLHELSKRKTKKKVILTLPLTAAMVLHDEYRTKILNWVTRYPEISGVYLIVEHERETKKQILNGDFLDSMLAMITELREAELSVIVGYTNTESLLYLLAGDVNISFGAYENTRMFSIDKFLINEEDRRGPKARLYIPKLFNWVQFNEAKDLKKQDTNLWKATYTPTTYSEEVFRMAVEPHFTQPRLYKHHFLTFSEQVKELSPLSRAERYRLLRTWLKHAISLDEAIQGIPVDFEKHGSGTHLKVWLDAANRYYASHLKT